MTPVIRVENLAESRI